mgnify:CR=1 FL=1
MASQFAHSAQQSIALVPAATAAIGGWTLAASRAMALSPRKPFTLAVLQGAVWVTLTGPHAGHGNERGDVFLQAGDSLAVPAGQRVVLEALGRAGDGAVRFDWVPAPTAQAASLWQQSVAQPLADLGQALRSAAGAAGRLVVGSGRFALHSIAPGARV